jgi:hypothetical protein
MLQVVAVLHVLLETTKAREFLNVDLDLRSEDTAPVAGGHKPDRGLVVGVLDRRRRDLDLLDELPLVGIDRIEPEYHVVLVHVCRRVTQRAERVHGTRRLFTPSLQPSVDALGFVYD